MNDKKRFAEQLLEQDSPSAEERARHRDALLSACKRRMWLEKALSGGAYLLVFALAFFAFLKREGSDNIVHVICWGALSLHILLWFLVYFLWRTNALLRKIVPITERANPERKITIAALFLFAFTTLLLILGFSLGSPVKASQMSVLMLWAPIGFLFWFAFSVATRVSKVWLAHEELELRTIRFDDKEG